MFLTDEQVEAMSGVSRAKKHRACTLRRWLIENGYTEKVDFFRRHDGWYSVIHPMHRAVLAVGRPAVRRKHA